MQQHGKSLTLTIFYGILDPAVVNAYILYNEQKPQNTLKRWFFHRDVAINMIKVLAQR